MGKCFVTQAIDGEFGTGETLAAAFDDAVDDWHARAHEFCTLPEHLGMSIGDYAVVLTNPSALDSVIERLRAAEQADRDRGEAARELTA